ncbi:MAG: NAD-dependent epimerase/dehydratase family protein [Flavobacteriales bacterium]
MLKTILLAGATGLVGSACLPLLLADERVSRVVVLVRRPLNLAHAKLEQWNAPDADLLQGLKPAPVDAVICCLGTTIKNAGSQAAFIAVDKHLPLGIARWAGSRGVPTYSIISALGASSKSKIFYSRVKGEVEQELEAMRFANLAMFQPSVLTGPRQEKRLGERIGIAVMNVVDPLLIGSLANYHTMPHDVLAKALVNSALSPEPGAKRYVYRGILKIAG